MELILSCFMWSNFSSQLKFKLIKLLKDGNWTKTQELYLNDLY